MGKTLVIAEKTKAAKALVQGLGYGDFEFHQAGSKQKPPNAQTGYFESDDTIIAYARGHLLKLFTIEEYEEKPKTPWLMDVLPYVPKSFELKPSDDWCTTQLKCINELINRTDVDTIVHYGDPDNEGELLVREILLYCNNRKPTKRLWCNSMIPSVVADAYFNLEDINAHTDMYYQALARQQTDWLLGINLSRYMLMKTGVLLPVGRVLVPIVKYIYDRDMAIKNFAVTKTWGINALAKKDKWKSTITSSDPELIFDEADKDEAEKIAKSLNSKDKTVKDIKVAKKKIRPKKLFNLSSFQSEMNKKYNYSLKEAGAIAQSLYESGLTTYPRTSVEYLNKKEEPNMKKTVAKLQSLGYPVTFHNEKSVFDDAKCIDGHTALVITNNVLSEKEINDLPEKEKNGYLAILNRTISNFTEVPVVEETVVSFVCDNIIFKVSGHKVITKGFLKYEKRNIKETLPEFKIGENVDMSFDVAERKTVPPSPVSPSALLAYLANPFADKLKKMNKRDDSDYYNLLKEGASLGTEATTMNIVDNAVKYGYISASKKSYSITDKGIALIQLLDKFEINLYRERNVELSKAMMAVGKRNMTISENKDEVANELKKIFSTNIKTQVIVNIPDKTTVGICPKCGNPVYEKQNSYQCSGKASGCKFFINKNDGFFARFGKKITPAIAKKLLSDSHSVTLNKLKSKAGKEYSLIITAKYDETDYTKGEFTKYETSFPPSKTIKKKGK